MVADIFVGSTNRGRWIMGEEPRDVYQLLAQLVNDEFQGVKFHYRGKFYGLQDAPIRAQLSYVKQRLRAFEEGWKDELKAEKASQA